MGLRKAIDKTRIFAWSLKRSRGIVRCVDSKDWITKDLGEVMVHARELYLLAQQQHAYLTGLVEARKFLMVKLGIQEAMRAGQSAGPKRKPYTQRCCKNSTPLNQ